MEIIVSSKCLYYKTLTKSYRQADAFVRMLHILLSPSMSGLRTLRKVCEEYATGFDVIFNGNKSQLIFFWVREYVSSNFNINVC